MQKRSVTQNTKMDRKRRTTSLMTLCALFCHSFSSHYYIYQVYIKDLTMNFFLCFDTFWMDYLMKEWIFNFPTSYIDLIIIEHNFFHCWCWGGQDHSVLGSLVMIVPPRVHSLERASRVCFCDEDGWSLQTLTKVNRYKYSTNELRTISGWF